MRDKLRELQALLVDIEENVATDDRRLTLLLRLKAIKAQLLVAELLAAASPPATRSDGEPVDLRPWEGREE